MLTSLFVAVLGVASQTDHAAGTWAPLAGQSVTILSGSYSEAARYIDAGGIRQATPRLVTYAARLNYVFGIHDRVSVVAEFPFLYWMTLDAHTDDGGARVEQSTNRSVGDMRAGVRGTFVNKPFFLGLEGLVGLPFGEQRSDQGMVTGGGVFEGVAAALASYTLSFWPLTVRGKVGYNMRTRGVDDAVEYRGEIWSRVWGPLGAGLQCAGSYALLSEQVAATSAEDTDARSARLGLLRPSARTLALAPHLTVDVAQGVTLRLFADVPLVVRAAHDAPAYGVSLVVLH